MKKIKYIAIIILSGYLLVILLFGLLLMSDPDQDKNALAASATDQDRILELIQIQSLGVPYDLVMMITSYFSETDEEALKKPFIFPALEFLVMTETVKEYTHHHDDDESPSDDDYHSGCGYETVEINTYEYGDAIKAYLGITDESNSDLNAANLEIKAQAAADARCSSEQIRIIQFNAISEDGYLKAIERCGIENEKDREGIFELYKAEYFKAWFEEALNASGIDYGEYETVIVGYNSVHSAIRGMTAGSVSDFDGVFISPIESNWRSLVTCEFGTGYVGHTGMDLGIPIGTRIQAVAAGKVIIAQSNPGGYGLYVVIDHGNGYATLYAHNSRLLVSAGDRVEQGQFIALSGNTGNVRPRPTPQNPAAGAHLHIEFVVNGNPRNAREYLP